VKSFKHVNILSGWAVFLFSLIVYLLTLEPTVSFWDCGEFIASAYKLQVGHPPGAPLYMIVGRIFSLFAPAPHYVAFMVNALSAIASALTVMFLYWTIVLLASKFVDYKQSSAKSFLLIMSGAIGSLTFAFTDSFWFSAVEAEVYAFSSLFTAVVFWAMLKWEEVAFEKHSNRWIILIAFLIGLSIGVHLLNLLAIPAIALIYYFKKHTATAKGVVITLLFSGIAIAAIMWGIILGTPAVAQRFEILFVNSFGLPVNSGMLAFIVILFAGLISTIVFSHKTNRPVLNMLAISVTLIMLGYSSYTVIMIRSKANPPMDENNPENAYTLMKYLNRSQYGKTPLLSGYYFNAPATGIKNGKPVYFLKDGKYIKSENQVEYLYDDRFKTFFPRMHSSMPGHERGYNSWGEIEGRSVSINGETFKVPTFSENLRFFFSYQLNHMYVRYFMWNFSGKQNDNQGHGNVLDGNWLTGIGFIDKARLGHNGNQPSSMANPDSTNRYFMLPFLLGILGLLYHYKNDKKDFWVVMLLFFMTGIAIVLYLNQPPFQPRERDYAYAGSFYAFAIWIGFGVFSLAQLFERLSKKYAYLIAPLLALFVPVLVLAQNYDDHNRSGRYIARDFGKNYLNSCATNAILFTYGDNDTFPLWYVQDVENERPDVRICNVTLLNGDWYIDQMKRKVYDSEPLPITMDHETYENDVRNTLFVRDDIKTPVELSSLMRMATSNDPRAKVQTQGGTSYNYLPTRLLKITVDKEKVIETQTVTPDRFDLIEDSIILEIPGRYISKSDLAILDILANNNWERPIYLDLSVVNTSSIKFDKYLQHEGFAYRFVPIKNKDKEPTVVSEILYDKLMNKFSWGNLETNKILLDENLKRTIEVVQIKNSFYSLANQLSVEEKDKEALQVIDKLYEILPLGTHDVSYYDLLAASVLYEIDEQSRGDELIMAVADTGFEKINFYLSMGKEYVVAYQQNIDNEISLLKEAIRFGEYFKRSSLIEKIDQKLDQINKTL
jgi:hypothetical protein